VETPEAADWVFSLTFFAVGLFGVFAAFTDGAAPGGDRRKCAIIGLAFLIGSSFSIGQISLGVAPSVASQAKLRQFVEACIGDPR